MSLELQKPDEQSEYDVPLSVGVIAEFHLELETFLDAKVAELKKLHPELASVSMRKDLIRGQCLCAVVTRLLKEPQ